MPEPSGHDTLRDGARASGYQVSLPAPALFACGTLANHISHQLQKKRQLPAIYLPNNSCLLCVAEADAMVAADSLVATPTAAAVFQPISPTPSQFLSVSASPSAAAQHNTILKLKCLLENPKLVESVRAEVCPNGLTLGDLFTMSAWSAVDHTWKGLFGRAAKAGKLYSSLAPACDLPDPRK